MTSLLTASHVTCTKVAIVKSSSKRLAQFAWIFYQTPRFVTIFHIKSELVLLAFPFNLNH